MGLVRTRTVGGTAARGGGCSVVISRVLGSSGAAIRGNCSGVPTSRASTRRPQAPATAPAAAATNNGGSAIVGFGSSSGYTGAGTRTLAMGCLIGGGRRRP